jgi:mRNA-degrading endonuclease RelE of RelBE toxin-antitoxin system
MAYTLNIEKSALKLFKKLPPEIQRELIHKTQILRDDPEKGEQLKGKYRNFRSLHLSIKGTAYRVIYLVYREAEMVGIVLVAPRENIYKRLEEMDIK